MPNLPEKPARKSWITGVLAYMFAAVSMVTMAKEMKLDLSLLIDRQGVHAKVSIGAEVSVFAAEPCAVDSSFSTVGICIQWGTRAKNDEITF